MKSKTLEEANQRKREAIERVATIYLDLGESRIKNLLRMNVDTLEYLASKIAPKFIKPDNTSIELKAMELARHHRRYNKILAIKELREFAGISLMESKNLIEEALAKIETEKG